jgi:hypothetical protein
MSQKNKVPIAVRKFFELKPIIVGEDEKVYDELRDALIAALEPRSIDEWLLVKDIIDTEWELQRQRKMKADIVTATMPHAFAKQLSQEDQTQYPSYDAADIEEKTQQLRALVNGYKPVRANALQEILAVEGLTMSSVAAKAFAATAPTQQHLERMSMSAYRRRAAASAEFHRMKQQQSANRQLLGDLPRVNASDAPLAAKSKSSKIGVKSGGEA